MGREERYDTVSKVGHHSFVSRLSLHCWGSSHDLLPRPRGRRKFPADAWLGRDHQGTGSCAENPERSGAPSVHSARTAVFHMQDGATHCRMVPLTVGQCHTACDGARHWNSQRAQIQAILPHAELGEQGVTQMQGSSGPSSPCTVTGR